MNIFFDKEITYVNTSSNILQLYYKMLTFLLFD